MLDFYTGVGPREMVVSAMSHVEGRSALSKLRRRHALSHAEADQALLALSAYVQRVPEQPISPLVLAEAGRLAERHSLRALDAVQLGCAVVLRDTLTSDVMRFIASDLELLDAARAERFEVWNPAEEPWDTKDA